MTFSEFISLFEPYLKKKKSFDVFLRDFVDLVIDDKKIEENPFDEFDNSFARKIVKGTSNFPVDKAKFLISENTFNRIKFEDEIIEFPNEEKSKIVEKFNKAGIQTTLKNFEEKASQLYYEIISDIAAGKRNQKSFSTNPGQKDLEQKYGLALLQECNNLCPLPECSKPLYIKKDGEQQPFFQIIQIKPKTPGDRFYNLLAVCPECSAKLGMEKSANDILRLSEIKQKMQKNEDVAQIASEEKIEQDITFLIDKITNAEEPEVIKLNYTPVEVARKFLPSEHMLKDSVKPNVVKYYNFIDELFKQKVEKENFNEKKLRKSVKHIYENLDSEGFSKDQIFEAITERFFNMTKESRIICQILTSYFVQSCEIFKVEEEK